MKTEEDSITKEEDEVVEQNSKEITAEYMDLLQNILVENEILQGLPIFKTIISICKFAMVVPNLLFMKNLYVFLNTANKMSAEEFAKAKEKISNHKNQKEVGERIINFVNRSEDSLKAELLAKALQVLNQDDKDVDFYLRLCHKISACYYDDLQYLKMYTDEKPVFKSMNDGIDETILSALTSVGLLNSGGFDGGGFSDDSPRGANHWLNEYGEVVRDLLED